MWKPLIWTARLACVLLGLVSLTVAGFSFSHLGDDDLDTPRGVYVFSGFLALFVGAGFIWLAYRTRP